MISSRVISIFFTLLLGIIVAHALDIKKCSTGTTSPQKVTINAVCNSWTSTDGGICELKKGNKITIDVEFEGIHDVRYIETRGVLTNKYYRLYPTKLNEKYIHGFDEIVFTNSNAKATSPMVKGERYIYKDSFDLKSNYPSGRYNLHWAVEDDGIDQEILCFEVEVDIKA